MAVLENLEPKSVFGFFEQMSGIPHGSGNTKAVSDWLVSFAKERGLEHYQDDLNNVIIIKEATPGYEAGAPIILQGHMDMVCAQAPDCHKDMEMEGLDLAIDGDTVLAKGTTLGGDDGIAVAMCLAILDADDIAHPRVECVFTVDEETGMYGAIGIDVSPLKAKQFLNIDSEDEGIFTVSCAGGNISKCCLPVVRTQFAGEAMEITISGLVGGHSGIEINKGRGNSSMLMGRVLSALASKTEMRLITVNGGQKDNAIANCTVAKVLVADAAAAQAVCEEYDTLFKAEYVVTDPKVQVVCKACEAAPAMDKSSTDHVVCMLTCLPNGIQVMSADIEGLVQTSLNLGVLTTSDTEVVASFCVRSSVESQKAMVVDRLRNLMALLGGSVDVQGDYPGWAYVQDSPLRDLLVEVYKDQYGKAPKVEAIHAGVECGMFAGKIPHLDCVSIGPDLRNVHTFNERLYIGSTQRTWRLLLETLKRMK